MLFWLFVIVLVIGVICAIGGDWLYDHTKYDTEWLKGLGVFIIVLAALAISISGVVMILQYTTVDAMVARNLKRYESLTYQLENNLYDNDNDLGKKELYNEIREWNEDLAYYRLLQNNFWLGIFYPDVFDQFEFITYEENERR